MITLNALLCDNSPLELCRFVSSCVNEEDLAIKLQKKPARLFSFVQNMKTEGTGKMALQISLFLYTLTPQMLENPEIKKVETLLRNRGLLNRETALDFAPLRGNKEVKAHKSILALESPYFSRCLKDKEFQQDELVLEGMKVSSVVYENVMEYLYASDEKRRQLISTLDKTLLPDMARLAKYLEIEKLKSECDEELCNYIAELALKESDLEGWRSRSDCIPKFVQLLELIIRNQDKRGLDVVIDRMQTREGAVELAAQCTPEEIVLFSTLKTEFGKACRIPSGTFGKEEWEKAFPITINETPPLPANIHAILELEDPCEPGKKLKETCQLFLRPEKVILHEEGSDKELYLSFSGVEELAWNAIDPNRRVYYMTAEELKVQMHEMPAAVAGWVLMRRQVIPGSRRLSFENQQKLLKGNFEVSKLMDTLLLNILTIAVKGKYLYETRDISTYTRCQEMFEDHQIIVGGLGPSSGLLVCGNAFDDDDEGLSGVWKF